MNWKHPALVSRVQIFKIMYAPYYISCDVRGIRAQQAKQYRMSGKKLNY
jgi:hypothetical protein